MTTTSGRRPRLIAPQAVTARTTWSRLVGRRDGRLWLPALLGVVAVAAQVAYPLVEGPARDRLTVATVVVFASASLLHAALSRGSRTGVRAAVVFVGGGLAVEAVGVATGVPFGTYAYAVDRLGPTVAGVPAVIPLAWSMVGWPAAVVAARITRSRIAGPLVGAVALASWDLYLDPQMVAEGYWTWASTGPHLLGEIPATNYLGWLAISLLMMVAIWPAVAGTDVEDDRVPVALYLWTWSGSLVAHLLFFDLPQSAAYGGVGMGVVVLALLRRCART